MKSQNEYIGDDSFKKMLDHYHCPTPLHVIKMRFAGAICSPNLELRPTEVISSFWPQGETPRLETKNEAELSVSTKNIMSVNVPEYDFRMKKEADGLLSYGFAFTAAELDDAAAELDKAVPDLLRLAEAEKRSQMLAEEIEKTRRRVNALEYTMIPQLENTIKVITMKLSENERGNLTRLMKVKDMMIKQARQSEQV